MSGVGYPMAPAYWTPAFARGLGLAGSFMPPFICTTVKDASSAPVRKSVLNLFISAWLGFSLKPTIASVFRLAAVAVYAYVLYSQRRNDGTISRRTQNRDVTSFPGAGAAPNERLRASGVCCTTRVETKFVVGATAWMCV
jgi:hypothetical protein